MNTRYTAVRYTAYALELLLLFVLQSTPRLLPEILGGKPLLLLPAALTIAFLEDSIPAMFFGLAGGVLLDFGYSDNVGYYAFLLTIICFVLSLIFRDYMVVSFLNATAFTAAITSVLMCVYFLFFFIFAGRENSLIYFVQHYISRIIFTILCGMPLYLLNKFIYRNLRDV
ncbi:MAG: rod shape-determining protein MreD [Ruminococcus sp.]|nr:rod shape-determining protein MreD [Ruminococcus sp.]